jgi:hypothetical protein
MARAVGPSGYEWDDSRDNAVAKISGGVVTTAGNDRDRDIELTFSWMDPGDRDRSAIRQNLASIKTLMERRFNELGWHARITASNSSLDAKAEISADALVRVMENSAKFIQQARGKFAF